MTTEKPTQGIEHKFLSRLAHLAGGARGHPFPQHPPHRLWELVEPNTDTPKTQTKNHLLSSKTNHQKTKTKKHILTARALPRGRV